MKRVLNTLLVSAVVIVGFNACSSDNSGNKKDESTPQKEAPKKEAKKVQEVPIKIRTTQAYNQAWNYYYPKVLVTAIVDHVTLKSVKINKGHCKSDARNYLPKKLAYGQQFEVRVDKSCSILKIDVTTDQGEWTQTY